MGTNCVIGFRYKLHRAIGAIHVHYDGDPASIRQNIRKYYNTKEKILALLEKGDVTSIDPNLMRSDTRPRTSLTKTIFRNENEFIKWAENHQALYIYLRDGRKWRCTLSAADEPMKWMSIRERELADEREL